MAYPVANLHCHHPPPLRLTSSSSSPSAHLCGRSLSLSALHLPRALFPSPRIAFLLRYSRSVAVNRGVFLHVSRGLGEKLDVFSSDGDGSHPDSTESAESGDRGFASLETEEDFRRESIIESTDEGLEQKMKARNLRDRVVFGLGIGLGVGGVVLVGGWVFAVMLSAAIFVASREYFMMIRSHNMANGMTPPPRYASRICSVICAAVPLLTLCFGQIDVSITSSAFIVAITLILQKGNPRFAQLSSMIFGLFYCGYLPSFWVKLRCGLAAPALNTKFCTLWPVLLGGPAHWTVGLIATLVSISSIIAADTCAFLGGKIFGHTRLTSISPNKTLEGAFAGLISCVFVAVVLSKIFCWPDSLLSAAAFGVLNFVGSIFGDLIESLIKRDAGVKDSGALIPGHGGILDRVDSYVFTGALSYSFVKTALPLFGI